MANITGGPLAGWVQNQIDVRQKALGSNTVENVLNNNNKNAWVRLASSADIVESSEGFFRLQGIGALGIGDGGNDLAKKYTLFGGVNFNPTNLGGVLDKLTNTDRASSIAREYSYGISDRTQGFQPIPGIESVNIRHINRGAIRNFEVRLKAHSKIQFAILETLYLRLGYYILLEWGHTNYFDRKGDFVKTPRITEPYENFINGEGDDNEINDLIATSRRTEGGNYDGALVKITNYNWSLDSDGTYSITLKGVGKGGLIESLTLNYPGIINEDGKRYTPYFINEVDDGTKEKVLKYYEKKVQDDESLAEVYSSFVFKKLDEGEYDKLFELGAVSDEEGDEGELAISFEEGPDDDNANVIINQRKSQINEKLFEIHRKAKKTKWEKIKKKERYKRVDKDTVSIKFDQPHSTSEGGSYEYTYITLHHLLFIIQEYLKTNPNAVGINIAKEFEDNFMLTHWFQHSTDPTVCVIPFAYYEDNKAVKIFYDILTSKSGNFRVTDEVNTSTNEDLQGKLMNIYVNIEHIAGTLELATDKETLEISLYNFLQTLINDINGALGGVNNLNVTYNDTVSNIQGEAQGESLQIRDDTIIPGNPANVNTSGADNEVELRLYGTQPGEGGSFVQNISTTSQVSSKLATQLSIGATASNINSSTTLLSRINKGVEDRIEKKSVEKNEPNNEKIQKSIKKLNDKQVKFIKDTYEDFKHPVSRRIETAKNNLKTLLEWIWGVKTVNNEIGGKGFIPINLSLEMQGLSGMLLYQRIKPSTEILPQSYTGLIDFIVMAVDHSIQDNTWTTTVNTLSVPKKEEVTPKDSSIDPTTGFTLKKDIN